jgi:hypothetical protein
MYCELILKYYCIYLNIIVLIMTLLQSVTDVFQDKTFHELGLFYSSIFHVTIAYAYVSKQLIAMLIGNLLTKPSLKINNTFSV